MTKKKKHIDGLGSGKTYTSVEEMVDDISSPSFAKKFRKLVRKRAFVKILMVTRCKQNLTDKQVAKKLGWTRKRVNQFEGSLDKNLNLKDVQKYCTAIGAELQIVPNSPATKNSS